MQTDEEFRRFFAAELRPHIEAWQRITRIRPPGVLDVVVVLLACLMAGAMWRAEPLWLVPGYALLRVMRDVRRVQGAFKQEVAGRFGSTDFWFSELVLARDKKDDRNVVFHGLFFIADFHKSFRGRTYLLPDVAERTFGTLGRVAQALPRFDGTELVELEDPDFEKRFVCTSTDPVEARYLLSPSLIQRILRMAERSSGSLRISFLEECLYLALPMGDLFRAPFLGSSVDENALLAFVRELLAVVGIVEELDLNTRIWSKGAKAGT
jgi:Protein of unknown function (DUF3137)